MAPVAELLPRWDYNRNSYNRNSHNTYNRTTSRWSPLNRDSTRTRSKGSNTSVPEGEEEVAAVAAADNKTPVEEEVVLVVPS